MNGLTKVITVCATLLAMAGTAAADEIGDGRRIYEEGVLPSGAPLTGTRFGSVTVSGRDAACITCHRRSGMGSVEGELQVPPVTGRFLFARDSDKALASMDRRSGRSMNQRHEPYTEATLATAIRSGIDGGGQPMQAVMPHYALTDGELHSLAAYLRHLSNQWSPGVDDHSIRFATVVTPDVTPARRAALIATLRAAFAQKNGSTITSRAGGRRHMVSAAEMVLGTERTWLLDVWELHGEPATWSDQLAEDYARAPVFALVSGTANGTWAPVSDFCEARRIPCWFPTVPITGDGGDYTLHFSRGIGLEAEVVAKRLGAAHAGRLIAIGGSDGVGRDAVRMLSVPMKAASIDYRPADDAAALGRALAGIKAGDTVAFWLRPAQLEHLAGITPPRGATFFFSGTLADGRLDAIPPRWRPVAHVLYPWELPQRRQAQMEYFRAWLAIRRLPLTDEVLQSEAYFSVDYLSTTVAEMLDNLYRDYLVERAQDMLGRDEGSRAEEQVRMALRDGPVTSRPRAGTTIYPHLNLGPGERFASKGAYVVGFGGAGGDQPVAESEWIVP